MSYNASLGLIRILGVQGMPTPYVIPLNLIKFDSYEAVDATLDLYDWRDSTGALHRRICENKQFKCEFQTKNMMTDAEFELLMNNIIARYTVPAEKKCQVGVFIPETGEYVKRNVYVPDIKPKVNHIKNGVIYYDSVRIAFIDYSEGDQQ